MCCHLNMWLKLLILLFSSVRLCYITLETNQSRILSSINLLSFNKNTRYYVGQTHLKGKQISVMIMVSRLCFHSLKHFIKVPD